MRACEIFTGEIHGTLAILPELMNQCQKLKILQQPEPGNWHDLEHVGTDNLDENMSFFACVYAMTKTIPHR